MRTIEACNCGQKHHTGANYYVSVMRDDGDMRALYGPFATHAEALENVQIANNKACDCDPRASFYAFGTVAMPSTYTTPGIINHLLPAILPICRHCGFIGNGHVHSKPSLEQNA